MSKVQGQYTLQRGNILINRYVNYGCVIENWLRLSTSALISFADTGRPQKGYGYIALLYALFSLFLFPPRKKPTLSLLASPPLDPHTKAKENKKERGRLFCFLY